MKLLCLSNDVELGKSVQNEAHRLSWDALVVSDRSSISQALRQYNPDLLMVEMPGDEDLGWWTDSRVPQLKPVVFVTGKVEQEFFTKCLDSGCDAFLPKAWINSPHFEARLKALLRWQNLTAQRRHVQRLGLTVDNEQCAIEINGQVLELTLTEFKILRELATDSEQVIRRADIQTRVFGEGKMSTRSLDVHVCSLRKKVKAVNLDIESVRGVGYRLSPCRS